MKIKEEEVLESLKTLILMSDYNREIYVYEIEKILLTQLNFGTIATNQEIKRLFNSIKGINDIKKEHRENVFSLVEKRTFLKPIIELIVLNLAPNSFEFNNISFKTQNVKRELLDNIKQILLLNYKFLIELINGVFENKIPYIVVENNLKIDERSIISSISNIYLDHVEIIQEETEHLDFFLKDLDTLEFVKKEQKRIEKLLNEEIKKGKKFGMFYNYSTYFLGCRKHLDTLKYNYFIHLKKEEKKEESPVFEITNELAVIFNSFFWFNKSRNIFKFIW